MASLPCLGLDPLPEIDLRHMIVLSDDTGIFQHATRSTPDLHHGYCTDDNARSLIAAMKVWALPEQTWAAGQNEQPTANQLLIASQRYLAFLAYAFNPDRGRYRNFMRYDRSWLEEIGSEDSHARTLWGLGKTVRFAPSEDIRDLAESLLLKSLDAVETFTYLKPCAYSLLGLEEYLRVRPDCEHARKLVESMSRRLFDVYQTNAKDDWPWWEDWLTWGNAKLPHAMLVGGLTLEDQAMVDASLKALAWMLDLQTTDDGHLSIIGNQGWYYRGREMARFDQQPIEAKALVQACLAAACTTGDRAWVDRAVSCFQWFTGKNDLGVSLYNHQTGGGHDGLEPNGINANQGAESTLAYVISVLELHHYAQAAAGEDHLSQAPALG
ncbi:MAG: hypothetical protein ACLFUJ_04645 [Phycisphaerae bacterium]